MNTSLSLRKIYNILYASYGPQSWWPADTPFEVMLGAILTQNTNWTNVERAVAGLRSVVSLTPAGVLSLPDAKLQEAIRPSGYFRQKAARLQIFCRYLLDKYDGQIEYMKGVPTRELRHELLDLAGIGPETADSILLYACALPVFVVDAYTVRLFARLGLCEDNAKYDKVQALFMDNLDPDVQMFNEYHALIVRHVKERCRKREPKCGDCKIRDMCAFYLRSQISDLR